MPENGLHLGLAMGGSRFEYFARAVTSLTQSLQCSSSSSSSSIVMTQKDMTYPVAVTNTAKRHDTTIFYISVSVVKWSNDFVRTKKVNLLEVPLFFFLF